MTEVYSVSSGSSEGPSVRAREVLADQRAIPNWPSFPTKKFLNNKFSVQKNYEKGNCLFESIRDATSIHQEEALPNAYMVQLPAIYREQVCAFYARVYYGLDDDVDPRTSYSIDADDFIDLIHEYDAGMPADEIINTMLVRFRNKEEMVEARSDKPHFRSICEDFIWGSSLDLFILSLLLNVDIYTYAKQPGGYFLTEASIRTAPSNVIFLLHTGNHFEALIPKRGGFHDLPRGMPRDARRMRRLWPELWDSSDDSRDSHSPMPHYQRDSENPDILALKEKRKSRKSPTGKAKKRKTR